MIDVRDFRRDLALSLLCYLNAQGYRVALLDDYEDPFLDSLFPSSSVYLDRYFDFVDKYESKEVALDNYIKNLVDTFPGKMDEQSTEDNYPAIELFNVARDLDLPNDLYILKFQSLENKTREIFKIQPGEIEKQMAREESEREISNLRRLLALKKKLEESAKVDLFLAMPLGSHSSSWINYILITTHYLLIMDGTAPRHLELLVPQLAKLMENELDAVGRASVILNTPLQNIEGRLKKRVLANFENFVFDPQYIQEDLKRIVDHLTLRAMPIDLVQRDTLDCRSDDSGVADMVTFLKENELI